VKIVGTVYYTLDNFKIFEIKFVVPIKLVYVSFMSLIQLKDKTFDTDLALFNELINPGIILHGHICPAMPLGIRASLEAMKRLNIERAKNKELSVIIENGPAHAALCFSEGVQLGTGATFGKGEIQRTNQAKNAFTLIDKKHQRGIRVSIKFSFFEKMMSSKFVNMRKQGIEPYDIDSQLPVEMIQHMLHVPADQIFDFSNITDINVEPMVGSFNYFQCVSCKEPVYEPGKRIRDGRPVCIACYNQ